MSSVKVEQRVNMKFLVKLGKSATETYTLLKEVYGDECLSRSQVFEWYKKFKEGREDIEDDPRPGRPRTSKTDDNIEKVCEIVRKDHRLSIRAIAEIANIDRETVRQILHDHLGMDLSPKQRGTQQATSDEEKDPLVGTSTIST